MDLLGERFQASNPLETIEFYFLRSPLFLAMVVKELASKDMIPTEQSLEETMSLKK